MGGSGGFGAFGGLVMVVSVVLMLRKQPPSAVGRLIRAGAVAPETAIKPATAGIQRPHELAPAIRRGLVHPLGDGRCWADAARVRRRRWIAAILVALALGVAAEVVWLGLRWLGLV